MKLVAKEKKLALFVADLVRRREVVEKVGERNGEREDRLRPSSVPPPLQVFAPGPSGVPRAGSRHRQRQGRNSSSPWATSEAIEPSRNGQPRRLTQLPREKPRARALSSRGAAQHDACQSMVPNASLSCSESDRHSPTVAERGGEC